MRFRQSYQLLALIIIVYLVFKTHTKKKNTVYENANFSKANKFLRWRLLLPVRRAQVKQLLYVHQFWLLCRKTNTESRTDSQIRGSQTVLTAGTCSRAPGMAGGF